MLVVTIATIADARCPASGPWTCLRAAPMATCRWSVALFMFSSTVLASNGTVLAFFAIDASPARALPSRAMAASRLPTGTPRSNLARWIHSRSMWPLSQNVSSASRARSRSTIALDAAGVLAGDEADVPVAQ